MFVTINNFFQYQCGFGYTFEFCVCVFLLFFFFFFLLAARVSEGTKFTVHILFNTVHVLFRYYSHTVYGTHSHFIQKKIYIKNRSHGTIHTFKNYFATVFSIFNFSKNKLYPNGPLVYQSKRFLFNHLSLLYLSFIII